MRASMNATDGSLRLMSWTSRSFSVMPFSPMVTTSGRAPFIRMPLSRFLPMVFGKNRDKGIRMNGALPEVVTIGENGITENDLLVHDINLSDPSVAFMLARMEQPEFPQPVGIFRTIDRPTYEDMMVDQIQASIAKVGPGNLEKLINSGDTWVVE